MLRNLMLKAAASPLMVRLFALLGRRSGLLNRFVAGEDLESAMNAVRELNRQQIITSLDLLGEGVKSAEAGDRAADAYIRLLEAISENRVGSNISIKLTQLGLDIGREVCDGNLKRILQKAEQLDNFVRIDMESSRHTQATLDLFYKYRQMFGKARVGIVVQSYLYRSEKDVRQLASMGCNVRLCKGAYHETSDVAYPKKRDVDRNFVKLLEIVLESDGFAAIATHDRKIIERSRAFIADNTIGTDRYEFQMLYGVRRDYQLRLRQQGYPVRVYVPFGTQWAPYFMRRLAERPANVLFITRSIFKR